MPRYYFDVREGEKLVRDHAGAELSNLKDAVESARFYASKSVSQSDKGKASMRVFEIRNSAGSVVAQVPFSEDNASATSNEATAEISNSPFSPASTRTSDHPTEEAHKAAHRKTHHDDAGRTG
jgi:hypothetical protein